MCLEVARSFLPYPARDFRMVEILNPMSLDDSSSHTFHPQIHTIDTIHPPKKSAMMTGTNDASIQAFFLPTPGCSPLKTPASSKTSVSSVGDGFTPEELQNALRPKSNEPWHPSLDYEDCSIRDLSPGPRAVSFMGRIANIFDVANTPKTPRSAKGCVKLCIKDDTGAITVIFNLPGYGNSDI